MYDYLHKYQQYVQPFMRVKPPFADIKAVSDPKSKSHFDALRVCY
jgi:hypothetical protein